MWFYRWVLECRVIFCVTEIRHKRGGSSLSNHNAPIKKNQQRSSLFIYLFFLLLLLLLLLLFPEISQMKKETNVNNALAHALLSKTMNGAKRQWLWKNSKHFNSIRKLFISFIFTGFAGLPRFRLGKLENLTGNSIWNYWYSFNE